MRISWCAFSLTVLLGTYSLSDAATIGISDFERLEGRQFVDFPLKGQPANILKDIIIQGITITANTGRSGGGGAITNCGFNGAVIGTVSDPGDGRGFCGTSAGSFPVPRVTFTFSMPVAAFGVTFQHSANLSGLPAEAGLLQIFESPNGTGMLLGTISSTGIAEGVASNDFVALWSTVTNIRSAVISGTGSDSAFAVDGYALSLSPAVPEPQTVVGMMAGLFTFIIIRWRRQ